MLCFKIFKIWVEMRNSPICDDLYKSIIYNLNCSAPSNFRQSLNKSKWTIVAPASLRISSGCFGLDQNSLLDPPNARDRWAKMSLEKLLKAQTKQHTGAEIKISNKSMLSRQSVRSQQWIENPPQTQFCAAAGVMKWLQPEMKRPADLFGKLCM